MSAQPSPASQAPQNILVLTRSGNSIVIDERGLQDGPFETELKGIHAEDTPAGREYMREIAEIFEAEYRKAAPID